MKFRKLRIWEVGDAYPLAVEFDRTSGYGSNPDAGLFTEMFENLYASGDGVIFGAFLDGALKGVFAGHVSRFPASRLVRAQDIFWYVTPAHRGGTTGVRLLKMFEGWAAEKGAERVLVPAFEGGSDKLPQFLENSGYQKIETFHEKRLK